MGNKKNFTIAVRLDSESADALEVRRDRERPGMQMAVFVRELVLRYLDGDTPPLAPPPDEPPQGGVTLDQLKQVAVFLGAMLSTEFGPEEVARYLDEHLDTAVNPEAAMAAAGGGS